MIIKLNGFSENYSKVIRDTFFCNMWSVIKRGMGGLSCLMGLISNRRGKFKLLVFQGYSPFEFPLLVGNPDLP